MAARARARERLRTRVKTEDSIHPASPRVTSEPSPASSLRAASAAGAPIPKASATCPGVMSVCTLAWRRTRSFRGERAAEVRAAAPLTPSRAVCSATDSGIAVPSARCRSPVSSIRTQCSRPPIVTLRARPASASSSTADRTAAGRPLATPESSWTSSPPDSPTSSHRSTSSVSVNGPSSRSRSAMPSASARARCLGTRC